MADGLRQRVYEELEPQARTAHGLSWSNRFLVACIIVASACAILETEPTLVVAGNHGFRLAELFFGTIFSIEYLLRLWIAPCHPQWAAYRFPRLRYAFSAAAIVDFLAIVPTLFALGPGGGSVLLRFFRILLELLEPREALHKIKKIGAWFTKGVPGGHGFRQNLHAASEPKALMAAIDALRHQGAA